jgi:hypothetical protein
MMMADMLAQAVGNENPVGQITGARVPPPL